MIQFIPPNLPRVTEKRGVFFTGDEHYFHDNILELQKDTRPFPDRKTMHSTLIGNHNATIGKNGHVIHTGDFCFGKKEQFCEIVSQLNGTHYFIEGDHDDALEDYYKWDDKPLELAKKVIFLPSLFHFTFDKVKISVCHYAMLRWKASHHNSRLAYAHSHGKLTYAGNAMDVGVDANGLHPISIQTFLQKTNPHE
jgi:calcineurin-like phosphoesterase family protein